METHHVARVLSLVCVAALIYNTRTTIKERGRWWEIVSGLRIHHFALAMPLLLAVSSLASYLKQHAPEWAQHGWMYYVGGVGSFAIGGTFIGTPDDSGLLHYLLYPFFLAIWFTLPMLAEIEERVFRGKAGTTCPSLRGLNL